MQVWVLTEEEPGSEFPSVVVGVYDSEEKAVAERDKRKADAIGDNKVVFGLPDDEDDEDDFSESDWQIDWCIEVFEVQ